MSIRLVNDKPLIVEENDITVEIKKENEYSVKWYKNYHEIRELIVTIHKSSATPVEQKPKCTIEITTRNYMSVIIEYPYNKRFTMLKDYSLLYEKLGPLMINQNEL